MLSTGNRLASYEIVAPIGAGGMGDRRVRSLGVRLRRRLRLAPAPAARFVLARRAGIGFAPIRVWRPAAEERVQRPFGEVGRSMKLGRAANDSVTP